MRFWTPAHRLFWAKSDCQILDRKPNDFQTSGHFQVASPVERLSRGHSLQGMFAQPLRKAGRPSPPAPNSRRAPMKMKVQNWHHHVRYDENDRQHEKRLTWQGLPHWQQACGQESGQGREGCYPREVDGRCGFCIAMTYFYFVWHSLGRLGFCCPPTLERVRPDWKSCGNHETKGVSNGSISPRSGIGASAKAYEEGSCRVLLETAAP